jgi:hypothetical protein
MRKEGILFVICKMIKKPYSMEIEEEGLDARYNGMKIVMAEDVDIFLKRMSIKEKIKKFFHLDYF